MKKDEREDLIEFYNGFWTGFACGAAFVSVVLFITYLIVS